ncbi:MAG: DUF59 domain-containing protein [Acidiferrobacterales bacterium]
MDFTPTWFRNKAEITSKPVPDPVPSTPVPLPKNASQQERIIAAIRTVTDPEMSVNVYDLGLIYDIEINDAKEVFIKMTLTAPGCPVAGILPDQVATAIKTVEGVEDAQVELVWDPPWSQDCLSDEAKLILGLL